MLFNASKSRIVIIPSGRQIHPVSISFDGEVVTQVESDKHLGILFGNRTEEENVRAICQEMCAKTNMLKCHFNRLPPSELYHLFKTYSMPMYASQVLGLSCVTIEKVYVTWRKCIRFLFDLPRRTHSNILPLIVRDFSIRTQIYTRACRFIDKLLKSKNKLIHACIQMALDGSISNVSQNLSFLSTLTGVTRFSPGDILKRLEEREIHSEADERRAEFVRDVMSVIRAPGDLCNLSEEELKFLLEFLCTT